VSGLQAKIIFNQQLEAVSVAKPHLPFTVRGLDRHATRIVFTIFDLLAAETARSPFDLCFAIHFSFFG